MTSASLVLAPFPAFACVPCERFFCAMMNCAKTTTDPLSDALTARYKRVLKERTLANARGRIQQTLTAGTAAVRSWIPDDLACKAAKSRFCAKCPKKTGRIYGYVFARPTRPSAFGSPGYYEPINPENSSALFLKFKLLKILECPLSHLPAACCA